MTLRVAFVLLLGCALPAMAQQSPTDVEMLNKYAGTWAVDCSKPAGTRLSVDKEALALSAGDKKLRTAAPITAFSYFGKIEPQAGFEVAVLGEARPTGLSLLAMKDAAGPYLKVDADPPLEKQFGQAALAGKFRRCL
jgi:invasion protein IalB